MSKKPKAKKPERSVEIPQSVLGFARRGKKDRSRIAVPVNKLPDKLGTPEARQAHDSAVKLANDWLGQGEWGGFYGLTGPDLYFPGYQALAMLMQKAEFRRPSEIIAKTMTRNGFKLKTSGDKDKSKEIRLLDAACRQHEVLTKLRQVAELDGGFGRGQIFIDVGTNDDAPELALPLFPDKAKVGEKTELKFTVIEPMWSYPANYDSVNPLASNFYQPTTWYVQQNTVHQSRLLTFVSREVPDILKPAYMFGGLSLTQMMYLYVENWLSAQQHVSRLIGNFSTSGIKTDMGNLTLPGAAQKFEARMELYNLLRDNQGVFALDKLEEFFTVATPLSSLDKLQAQAQEHMAAVTGIPLVVFFGITPSGLNASTDGEIRAFYDWIHALQEQLFSPNLKLMLDYIQLNLFGVIDPDITFEWEPLWQLDAVQLAAVEKTKADTDAVYITNGVVDPEDVRTRLAGDDMSVYHGLNPDDVPKPDPNAEPIDGKPDAGGVKVGA